MRQAKNLMIVAQGCAISHRSWSEKIYSRNDRWNMLADEAARKLEASGQPVRGGFYTGVMFGVESARDELAAALASAITAQ
jgi:hypothetical protein